MLYRIVLPRLSLIFGNSAPLIYVKAKPKTLPLILLLTSLLLNAIKRQNVHIEQQVHIPS